MAEVLAVGSQTELGKIGKSLRTLETEQTLLQQETRPTGKNTGGCRIDALCTSGCNLRIDPRQYAKHGAMDCSSGITMAMATLPEELPGGADDFSCAGRMADFAKRVLTRRCPAIETLGAATVLCVDKTGTLTMNQMSVQQFYAEGRF